MPYFFPKFIPTDTNQQMIDFTLYNERAANAEWLTDINFLFFIWFVLQCTPWEIDWKLPPTMSAMSKRKKQDKISRLFDLIRVNISHGTQTKVDVLLDIVQTLQFRNQRWQCLIRSGYACQIIGRFLFFSKTFLSLLNGCHGKLIFGQTLAYIARGSQPCQGMLRITPGFATPHLPLVAIMPWCVNLYAMIWAPPLHHLRRKLNWT